jgi:hypothetical protein
MTVSELLEALKNSPPNAQLLVVEGGNLTAITSVVEGEKSEKSAVLMGEAFDIPGRDTASRLLKEAMVHGEHGRIFNTQISKSPEGKFIVGIDGKNAMGGEFDTQQEAMASRRGFVLGFNLGGGIKNMADGGPPTIG